MPAPAPALVEMPPEPKGVQFDDEDDEPPAIALGEEVKLDDSEFDEDESDDESVKVTAEETVSLNL